MNNETIKILVVDDEEICTSILEHILKPLYTVFVANSGYQAIEMAKEIAPDLILLDVMMSDISGFEVFEKLSEIVAMRNIPVIFITGLNNIEDEEKGFFLGAVDYITKPFYNSIVLARVRTHVQIINHIRTIEQKCMIDTLTGLPNRRAFDERLKLEWDKAARAQKPLGMLFMDMDNFKHYNDTYGHPFGDVLIQTVANVSKQTLKRATDLVSRWGGDEFAAILPDTSPENTRLIAEMIRSNVKATSVPTADGTSVSITVSVGVNTVTPQKGDTIAWFMEETDKSLYIAKSKKEVVIPRGVPAAGHKPAEPGATRPAEATADSGVDGKPVVPSFMSLLKDVPSLGTVKASMALGGSEELYEKIIRLMAKTVPQNAEQMRNILYDEDNIQAFGIKIHGMAGSLNQVGNKELAGLAKSLEKAAKSGDAQYCREHYGDFQERLLQFYRQLSDIISQADMKKDVGKDAELDNINDFNDTLAQAADAAEDFDCILAAELISPLLSRSFAEGAGKLLSEAFDALEEFQAQQALERLAELRQKYLK